MLKRYIKKVLYRAGYQIGKIPKESYSTDFSNLGVDKIHYGCGGELFFGKWLNVDFSDPESILINRPDAMYRQINLTERHPFVDELFQYGYSQDFIEHLDQAESLCFLVEAYRTLRPDGVLRLSFPGFEAVLKHHYYSSSFEVYKAAMTEAYKQWGHKHFYSKESLRLVATNIGFRKIEFVDYGKSEHTELHGLDSRIKGIGWNIYAELTK